MTAYPKVWTLQHEKEIGKLKVMKGSQQADIEQAIRNRFGLPEDVPLGLKGNDTDKVLAIHGGLATGSYRVVNLMEDDAV